MNDGEKPHLNMYLEDKDGLDFDLWPFPQDCAFPCTGSFPTQAVPLTPNEHGFSLDLIHMAGIWQGAWPGCAQPLMFWKFTLEGRDQKVRSTCGSHQ